MGSLDCGVGSIVWVRRRNGSWWPGRILGPNDVSTSHLTSPRSGTPVKLLGREDASIDWYNLEKSKRVKAFRCGEFDDCIERAEASQGLPPRKREKYARREDAILHALQLERQLLKKQGKLSDHMSNKSSGTVKKDSSPLEKNGNDDRRFVVSKASKARGSCQPSREKDLDTVPRTKGLRDFGLRIAPSKRKVSPNDTCEVNNNSQDCPDDLTLGNVRDTNGMELMGAAFQPKRSKCVSSPTDPTNFLEGSKEIPSSLVEMAPSHIRENNHPPPDSAAEMKPSRVLEVLESDSSDTESDTETEPDLDGRMSVHSDVSLPLEADLNALRRPGAPVMDESLSSEDCDGSPFSRDMTNIYPHGHVSGSETVSKWQLKGKRNIRSVAKRPVNATRGRGSLNRFTSSGRRILRHGYYQKEDFIDDDDDDDADFYPEDTKMDRVGVDNREYMFTPRSVSKSKNSLGRDLIDLESGWEDQTAPLNGHGEDRWEQFDPIYVSHHYYSGKMRHILIDVDLKVQGAGYQKGSVPLISLTSKVTGQAVVGHPVQFEVLEDGSTDNLISNNVSSDYEMTDCEGVSTLPPAWKTARRTANARVPRPHVSSNLDGNEYAEELSPSDQEMEEPVKRSSLMRKRHTNISHPVNSGRYSGKAPPKKVSISPGQRTRTLSSISADQKFSNSQMNGSTKTESQGPRSVALIPCKLVFSRLLEKINRPPAKANSNVLPSDSNTDINLS